jgi:hypothetical protein
LHEHSTLRSDAGYYCGRKGGLQGTLTNNRHPLQAGEADLLNMPEGRKGGKGGESDGERSGQLFSAVRWEACTCTTGRTTWLAGGIMKDSTQLYLVYNIHRLTWPKHSFSHPFAFDSIGQDPARIFRTSHLSGGQLPAPRGYEETHFDSRVEDEPLLPHGSC